jgi:hypothetical protein
MTSGFIEDGRDRLICAIRAQVAAEFSEELAKAGAWQRFLIRQKIEAEVGRRVAQQAPEDGLYLAR